MLTSLQLKNFRCFEDHLVPLHPVTIVVGSNNAGKSTIIEALRLVSIVANRYQDLAFSDVPSWLWNSIPRYYRGVSPSMRGIEINFENVFHRYGNAPAQVTATFDTGNVLDVYIGDDTNLFAVIKYPDGSIERSKGDAKQMNLPSVSILPQITPLSRHEHVLTRDTVRGALSSSLASSHFRNQLALFHEYFSDFKQLAEGNWKGLGIGTFKGKDGLPGAELTLQIRDEDFVAEVGLMGHGLQMWLQTIWFLARATCNSTVILDEPDVYMHADLQRKIIRLLRGRYKQTIIATHSVEIMSEVDASQILVVDKHSPSSGFADSLPAVQNLIDNIGGVHNIQLTRLWSAKKCLFVEGDDVEILERLQNILYPNTQEPLGMLPVVSLGGWGGWYNPIASSMPLNNSTVRKIFTYCIFDSDYYPQEELDTRLSEAQQRGIELHIWERKEIENYLLVPEAIVRIIASHASVIPSNAEICTRIDQIADSLCEETSDAIANELFQKKKKEGVVVANRKARQQVKDAWATREGRISIVSGKEVLSQLSGWSKANFGVSFSSVRVAQALQPNEIAQEVTSVLQAIELNKRFSVEL